MRKYVYPILLIISLGLLLFIAQSLHTQLPGQTDSFILLPELIPPPGFYSKNIIVRMKPSHPQGIIIFTIDGSEPSASSGTLYSQPILLDNVFAKVTTIRAVEVVRDRTSPIVTASYALCLQDDIPLAVITTEPSALWDQNKGLLANPGRRGAEWEREVEFALLNLDAEYVSSQKAGIRIIGEPLLSHVKHSFRLYFRTEYQNPRLDFNPFRDDASQLNKNIYKRLLLQASRYEKNVNLVYDQLVTDILSQMGIPVANSRIVHLIINGDSWGIYRLTERVDNIFLEDNLNIMTADIVQEGNAREGTDEAWNILLTGFSETESVSDLKVIESTINIDNFIITSCIQKYFQLPTDAFYAIHPDNGRWFWIYEGGGTVPEHNSDFNTLYLHLIRNSDFRYRYAAQCSALLNTYLSSDTLSELYTEYSNWLSPHFGYEQIKWPHTPPWEVISRQQLHYLHQRESQVRSQLMAELDIQDIVSIEFLIDPDSHGMIYVNGEKIICGDQSKSCLQQYFSDTDLILTAVAKPGYVFSHWLYEISEGLSASSDKPSLALTLTSDNAISAYFLPDSSSKSEPKPDDVHINEYWINDNGTRYASIEYRLIEGDWIELLVEKPGTVDLRRWRVTDNNTITDSDEGSIILPDLESLATIPKGTVILIIATKTKSNDENFPFDDLSAKDRRMIFYIGNGNLDIDTDPGFDIHPGNDNVALVAPGLSKEFTDDVVVDFITEGLSVTAYRFGALKDGVTFDQVFSRLGSDDGALLTVRGSNDNLKDWLVDPDSCMSGDALCANSRNYVTPGRINPAQSPF